MAGASFRWTALRSLASLSLALLALTAAAGCGVAQERQTPPLGQGGGGGESAGSGAGGCTDGATRDCHITLSQHGSVLTCYAGTETCANGRWGACTDGAVQNYKASPGQAWTGLSADPQGAPTPLALSDAGPCVNNPCDPTCMQFNENPLGGGMVSLTSWSTGSLVGLQNIPGGLIAKGIKTPCATAADCQFNQYCDNPASGTCSHHKCAPGDPLVSGCDPCVTSICAANPSCCVTAPACLSHDVCVQGGALAAACNDPCVTAVCGSNPSCCSSSWDATCVGLVASKCAKSCPSWSQACVNAVHDKCGDICDNASPACAHDKCFTGAPLGAACDPCVSQICLANPSCCTGAWDATCAAQVTTICGQACPAQGLCKPWIPGMTDPKCAGPDITVGIPCGTNTVPVCNVGTQTAPAGINVVAYPGGSGLNGGGSNVCSPGAASKSCGATPQPIPPGGCVDVACAAALSANDEIIANPPGPGYVSECQCLNNWSIFSSSPNIACEPLSCAGVQPGSESEVPNMLVSVERSSAISAANWTAIQTGLNNFFKNNTAATNGVGVALQFFPDKNASPAWDCNTTTCDQSQCKLRVPFNQRLTTLAGASDPEETALVNAVAAQPSVDANPAPTGAALQAALRFARVYLPPATPANVKQSVVLAFIMASEPSTCNPPAPPPASVSTPGVLAGLASTIFVQYGIKTNVIGVGPSVSWSTINAIATAGGGQAYAVPADANLSTNLTNALLAIRGNIFSCVFPLPPPGLFDPNGISVKYLVGGQTMSQLIPQFSGAAACGMSDGYYLDNTANPTQVILCPNTCTAVNTYNPAWGITNLPFIKVFVNCPPAVTKQVYTDNCPPGTKVQWGFLGWDTTDPSGTSVVWQARTANTSALLPMASFYNLGTSQSAPTNTQLCPIGSPCAVDLYKKFNGPPDANRDFLELSLTLNQNAAMTMSPSVNNWKITYSCPPSE